MPDVVEGVFRRGGAVTERTNRDKVMKNEEHKLQVACVKWFRYQYPDYAKRLFAIPNGGARNVVTGAMLKAEGVLPGVPDLFLAAARNKFHGLFIEMKAGGNKVSKAQSEMIDVLKNAHYKVVVCNSFEQFQAEIDEYFNIKKEKGLQKWW